ncbi:MAG TPA: gliding motility-associated C-terminal domain-containing protein [Chitinophagales bacterium]|nr:gliding motility-associated C-terminal domain-containing protein [Chitinophagales bacterium]HRK28332.1 gliding motility-associated C-terminal domain-containing protein [Chitinophagales bacterium]
MKHQLLFFFACCCLLPFMVQQASGQVCSPSGNLIVFSNYDGGILNLNIDADIPDLRIGICTYEPVQVNISGAFAGNITQVMYAGYNSTQNNNNCGIGNFPTSISGVPPADYSILTIPAVTLNNPNGYNFGIICAYSCNTGVEQGGCNTIDQVLNFFDNNLGGSLYALHVQYCCWLNSNTYSVAALAGSCCSNATGTADVTYTGLPYCTGIATPQLPTITGSLSGSFSALPAGLNLNATTGAITPAGSIPGNYTVTYSVPGCPGFTTTTAVQITAAVPVSISYEPNVACTDAANLLPTITGNTGGVFEASPQGLSIDPVSGLINPPGSLPGNYVVSYTSPLPCPATATVNVAILAVPVSGFAYAQSVYCAGNGIAQPVLEPNAQLGAFAALPTGLVFADSTTGAIDLAASLPGIYTVTHTVESGGCQSSVTQVQVTIQAPNWAAITYPQPAQYCNNLTQLIEVAIEGSIGGSFLVQPDGLWLNNFTGSINPDAALPGSYEVTYTLAAAGACPAYSATAAVVILPAPQVQITASAQTITPGETVTLTATGADVFSWNSGQTTNSIAILPTETTNYCVTGANTTTGCEHTACITITVATQPVPDCVPPIAPNAFSPNNDGINDKWGVTTNCLLQNFELAIFNRWGQRVFYATNPTERWDGSYSGVACELGAYVYYLTYKVAGGKLQKTSGSVLLVW